MSEHPASPKENRGPASQGPLDVLREFRPFIPDWNDGPTGMPEEFDAALRAVEQLERALKWYAERRNYVPAAPPKVEPPKHLMATDAWDGNGPGARARAALALFDRKEQTP